MKLKYIVGTFIIVTFLIWAGISFNKTLTPYVTIAEAKTSQSIVQVKGKRVDAGRFDLQDSNFTFTLVDEKGEKLEVVYAGTKPGNFEQATDIVCVGQYEKGRFHAKELLVKCPSKYMEEQANL